MANREVIRSSNREREMTEFDFLSDQFHTRTIIFLNQLTSRITIRLFSFNKILLFILFYFLNKQKILKFKPPNGSKFIKKLAFDGFYPEQRKDWCCFQTAI